jgi:hypothetical protein
LQLLFLLLLLIFAHSFFDAVIFCASRWLGKKPALRSQLCMAYLETWRTYESQERLVEAFSLAESLARLHQAIRLQQCLALAESPWEQRIRDGLIFLLRSLLSI